MVPLSLVMSGISLNSSPKRRLETVCRTNPPDSVRSSPNVRLSEALCTAFSISLNERSCRRNPSSLSSMDISRSRVPSSRTWETDGSSNNSSRRFSAASRRPFSSTAVDDTASVMTSRASCWSSTSGWSAVTGGKFSMPATAVWTSFRTRVASAKFASSMRIWPRLSDAVPTTRSTPVIPMTLSSILRLTSSSTSLGDAPGNGTVTVTVRRSMGGKCWTARCVPEMIPPTMKNSMSRLAATGLPAK